MGKAVFVQNPVSAYDDIPGECYHFPKRYLRLVEEAVGDWVVFYEGRQGRFGYVAVQQVTHVTPDRSRPEHFYAWMDHGSKFGFENVVRVNGQGHAFERALRAPDGKPISGGANTSAVRRLTEAEFAAIWDAGTRAVVGPDALTRDGRAELDDPAVPFGHAPLTHVRPEILVSRALREASFARQVKRAYGGRCAISDLGLRNGGGRSEVEAAHIRPVERQGPDIVSNGLALSATVHWMFDRGLIAVADDFSILVSRNKVPVDVAQRLIRPEGVLRLPEDRGSYPHPAYLKYHREEIFGRSPPPLT